MSKINKIAATLTIVATLASANAKADCTVLNTTQDQNGNVVTTTSCSPVVVQQPTAVYQQPTVVYQQQQATPSYSGGEMVGAAVIGTVVGVVLSEGFGRRDVYVTNNYGRGAYNGHYSHPYGRRGY